METPLKARALALVLTTLALSEPGAAQTPAAQTPAAQTPAAQTPAAQTPAAQTPAAQTPAAQTPAAQTPAAQTPAAQTPLQDAAIRYPPLIMGPGVTPADGTGPFPRDCTPPGGVVEPRGQPATIYRGADPAQPELCRFTSGGEDAAAWFGIWVTSWPGADQGHDALRRIIHGKTGDVAAFDVVMTSGASFHDLIRNEGVENLVLLNFVYTTLKISHYREGFNGNNYRSVATVWKDFDTGMILYATYQHISGRPELDDPLDPSAITPP